MYLDFRDAGLWNELFKIHVHTIELLKVRKFSEAKESGRLLYY